MKVSIVTSCYNREKTIRGAVESVLAQDYSNIEYIIVDAASKDGSLNIINEYKDHITKIISEPDSGMYEGINKGIRASTGDLVGLLHSDDFFYDNHVISRIVENITKTGANFLYGNGLFVNSENTNKVVRKWISGSYRIWKMKHGWLPLHPTCYIRKDIIEKCGVYNETYKIAADSDFLFRYLLGGDLTVVYLDEYIVKMRMGGMSTDKRRRKQMWKEDIRMYQSHGFNPVVAKIEKMIWKIPQFIKAKFM